MQVFQESSRIVAPVSQMLASDWSRQGFAWDAFFDSHLAQRGSEIVFYNLDIKSQLFNEARTACVERQLRSNFVVSVNQFLSNADSLVAHLKEDILFSILVTEDIPPALFVKLDELSAWKEQLSLVIVARNDWNFRQTFRCIPHTYRHRLYLDFPISFEQSDPFYSPQDLLDIKESLQRHFGEVPLPNFCPNLKLYTEKKTPVPLVKTVEFESETFPFVPVVSIVVRKEETLEAILSSPAVLENQSQIEVISGDASQEVLLRYNQHFKGRSVFFQIGSDGYPGQTLNQLSHQAHGTYFFFADECSSETINNSIEAMFEENETALNLAIRQRLTLLNSDQFIAMGGFNTAHTSVAATEVDILLRAALLQELVPEKTWCEDLLSDPRLKFYERRMILQTHQVRLPVGIQLDEPQLSAKFISAEVKPVVGTSYRLQRFRDLYSQLFKFNAKVLVEGHLAFLSIFIKKILNPFIPKRGGRLDFETYTLYWTTRHWIKTNIWRFGPQQLGWLLHWLTTPFRKGGLFDLRTHSFYWATRHWIKTNIWRFGPNQLGWLFHWLTTPVRKGGLLDPRTHSIYWENSSRLKGVLYLYPVSS